MRRAIPILALVVALFVTVGHAAAASPERGGTITDRTLQWPSADEWIRVVALRDHNTRVVVLGTLLLGVAACPVAGWSIGVNTMFELAVTHPQRVTGLFALAGVPGETFG